MRPRRRSSCPSLCLGGPAVSGSGRSIEPYHLSVDQRWRSHQRTRAPVATVRSPSSTPAYDGRVDGGQFILPHAGSRDVQQPHDDCDTVVDDGFDKQNDPRHCGGCTSRATSSTARAPARRASARSPACPASTTSTTRRAANTLHPHRRRRRGLRRVDNDRDKRSTRTSISPTTCEIAAAATTSASPRTPPLSASRATATDRELGCEAPTRGHH